MPVNARQYRDDLYRLRRHPGSTGAIASEPSRSTDSWSKLYLSIVPFLILEYVLEMHYETMISGFVFPTGYLLFWAFYFSYYRPGSLETALSDSHRTDLSRLPFLFLGTAIWLVKNLVTMFGRVLGVGHARPKPAPARPKIVYSRPQSTARPHTPPPRPKSPPPPPPGLPREVVDALAILGLAPCRDWNLVHKRYRELAKKFHPDLNHEITSAGSRFMMYDAAYKRLYAVRARYFIERRDRG
jgi:hypothetical protein